MKQRTHWGMTLAALLVAGGVLVGAALAWLRAAAGALAATVLTATLPASASDTVLEAQPEATAYWYGVTVAADAVGGVLPPPGDLKLHHENAGPPGVMIWAARQTPCTPPGQAGDAAAG